MAFANFRELAAALADWLDRDDLASRIPAFVALAESKLNRVLRLRDMERDARIEVDPATGFAELPEDCLELRAVQMATTPFRALRLVAPEQRGAPGAGEPRGYVLFGRRLRPAPDAGRPMSLDIAYYARIPPLEAVERNWLLDRHPDLYLYGALLEAEAFIVNPDKIALWRGLFEQSLDAVNDEDRHVRWSGSSLAPLPAAAIR